MTLPAVFPKMFWTSVWWKTRVGYFWHYVFKTIYWCSRKAALTVYTAMCSASFFMEIKNIVKKEIYSQRDSVGTDRENIVPANLCITWRLKWFHHFLMTLEDFSTEKGLHDFLTTLKGTLMQIWKSPYLF